MLFDCAYYKQQSIGRNKHFINYFSANILTVNELTWFAYCSGKRQWKICYIMLYAEIFDLAYTKMLDILFFIFLLF